MVDVALLSLAPDGRYVRDRASAGRNLSEQAARGVDGTARDVVAALPLTSEDGDVDRDGVAFGVTRIIVLSTAPAAGPAAATGANLTTTGIGGSGVLSVSGAAGGTAALARGGALVAMAEGPEGGGGGGGATAEPVPREPETLNIGAGRRPVQGATNIDVADGLPGVLRYDVRGDLGVAPAMPSSWTGRFDQVRATLLPGPLTHDSRMAAELARVMRPGGTGLLHSRSGFNAGAPQVFLDAGFAEAEIVAGGLRLLR